MQPLTAISAYQQEQLDAVTLVSAHLDTLPPESVAALKTGCRDYLQFREETDAFLSFHFASVCTQNCYRSNLSACCSREGIIAFFADIVINLLFSFPDERHRLVSALMTPNTGPKCVYLGPEGCMWRIKPIVCQMFLCDAAMERVFQEHPSAKAEWNALKTREKSFTWPDRKILFDDLETVFMDAGYDSSLMYLHRSPGLLLVKKRAGR